MALCQFGLINSIIYFDILKYSLEHQKCYSWFSLQPSIAVKAARGAKNLAAIGVKYVIPHNFGVEYKCNFVSTLENNLDGKTCSTSCFSHLSRRTKSRPMQFYEVFVSP